MSDRDYRVVRSSRPVLRDRFAESQPDERSRSKRDYRYDEPYTVQRSSRDGLSTRSVRGDYSTISETPSTTRTTYKVASNRDTDPYVTKGNVIVLDSRLDRDRDLSDWEVIRPERSESGAYVIETSSISDNSTPARRRDIEYDDYRRTRNTDIELLSPTPRSRRDRSLSRGTLEAMREVRVTEDSSDDDRRSTRSRRTARNKDQAEVEGHPTRPPLTRTMSSLRHDHSPESETRRRSRSIGFFKEQISHHDATERKHERPGAEANNAGRYLIDHRGERVPRRGYVDAGDDESMLDSVKSRGLRKSKTAPEPETRIDTYGAEVRRRYERGEYQQSEGYYEDHRAGYEEDRRGPYEPQEGIRRSHSQRRRRRDRERERDQSRDRSRDRYRDRGDDEESRVSEYYDKRVRKYH